MPPKSLPALAAELAAAQDIAAAVRIINDDLSASDRQTGFVLLMFDSRRGALVNAALAGPSRADTEATSTPAPPHSRLALDHLPPATQYAILAGQRFSDVGDQANQYARLLGLDLATSELRLALKGIVLEGALAAVVALYDTRRRVAPKLLERAEPLASLFELAYARFYERDARFEAVAALHDVTTRLRAEHGGAVAALEREVQRLRAAQRAGTSDVVRQLRDAVAAAERRAIAAEQRLRAVEEQVVNAVDRLEHTHVQLHEQDNTIRAQRQSIRELQLQLPERSGEAVRS